MQRRWMVLALMALLVGCSDCEDRRSSGEGNNAANNAANNTGSNNGREDAGGEDTGEDVEGEDVGEDVAEEEDVPPGECRSGERRCLDDVTYEVCSGERWGGGVPCAFGYGCSGGTCMPDASRCEAGQRICLDGATPAVCDPGVAWEAQAPCRSDQGCVDGECRSGECYSAAANSSYLGCDYWATDLPNIAWAPVGGTPNAPLGLVLTNPSLTDVATVSLFEADGDAAPLVGEVTVTVGFGAPLGTQPVTVRTELRDESGGLTEAAFTSSQGVRIPPGGMAVFLLANHGYSEQTQVKPWGWQVRAERPVAAYQFNPYCCNYSFTNDASLLFPTATWGTAYRYVGVPTWGQAASDNTGNETITSYPATLTVIADKPRTQVRVELPPGGSVQTDQAGRVQLQGSVATATLDAGEVLHLMSGPAARRQGFDQPVGPDLSGAKITASAPIAVFSGHLCTYYPQDQEACDHLEEQLFPTDTWGDAFSLVPTVLRTQTPASATEATFWKIVADQDGTVITFAEDFAALSPRQPGFEAVPYCGDKLTGANTLLLNAGEFCEFGTRTAVNIDATEDIMVMGIVSGQASTGFSGLFGQHAGDPSIFLVPPRRQYRSSYAFLAPTTYFNDYLTVVTEAGAFITLDGEPVDLSDATPISGSQRVYKHLVIEDGPHQLEGTFPFGILVFSYDDYVSYAFTGGLNLIKGRGQR